MSSAIGEPFQLFLSSTHSQGVRNYEAVYCTYDRDLPGYATVTAQGDGVHLWDLRNIHAAASYSVGQHVAFAAPAFTLRVTEDENTSVISYAIIGHLPGSQKGESTIRIIRQSFSGSSAASQKTVVDNPLIRIYGTSHATVPLLLVSENASLSLADAQVNIKSQLDWPGEREHLETFVFPRESCSFIQDNTGLYRRAAITCCQAGLILYVRLVLLGDEIVPVGTCEIPIASSASGNDTVTLCLTCSPSGILSFIDSRGMWATYQLASLNSTLVYTTVSEHLRLQRFSIFERKKPSARGSLSLMSLGTSLVLLVALVEESKELSLQIWDLSYGVLLTAQSMPLPFTSSIPRIRLTAAGEGQVLLTVSPAQKSDKKAEPKRSSVYIIPVDARLQSNLASALGKTALTAEWLAPNTTNNQEQEGDDGSAKIISAVRRSLQENNVQKAEQTFLKWVDSHSSREAVLGYEFVKKILNIILPQKPSPDRSYTPRITRCLLENAVVSTIMLNGRLITALRERGDWENVMLALTTVADITEDELMASAKLLIDRQCRSENAMEVDTPEGYLPPLWSYLFACVSYPFSAAPMRMAIRKHLPDAQDLVLILEVLENWIQGGTEHEMEALLKSVATDTKMAFNGADSPPYPKVITFLQALLDASFVALLQYQPSYDPLRRILSYIEPEIALIDNLEPLRGMLEPFARAQSLKEKIGVSSESPAELRKEKKELEQWDALSVGLYRLEELVI